MWKAAVIRRAKNFMTGNLEIAVKQANERMLGWEGRAMLQGH
jgi:hypothetical protein